MLCACSELAGQEEATFLQLFHSFAPDCRLSQFKPLQGRLGRNVPPCICLGETSQPSQWVFFADGLFAVLSSTVPLWKQSSAQISHGKASCMPNEGGSWGKMGTAVS